MDRRRLYERGIRSLYVPMMERTKKKKGNKTSFVVDPLVPLHLGDRAAAAGNGLYIYVKGWLE